MKHIHDGPDWDADVISPQTRFFKDVKEDSYEPSPGSCRRAGPQTTQLRFDERTALGRLARQRRRQIKYWDSTAIFVMWDDYGGWYDHVPPPMVDYDGLGIRVPLIIVSPYAKKGYVSHVQFEHGSLLRFIEDRFSLPHLGATDARANSPALDCFNFSAPPRAFAPIPARLGPADFERWPPDPRPVDTN